MGKLNKYRDCSSVCYLVFVVSPFALLGVTFATGAQGNLEELFEYHPYIKTPIRPLAASTAFQQASNDNIPRIIHQTWRDPGIPQEFKSWASSWNEVNTQWLHVVWSNQQNRKLVEMHYPFFLRTYDDLPVDICRADAIRAVYLHRFGGVYVDLDSKALKPLEPLLNNTQVAIARLGNDLKFEHSISNAFMASAPGEQFWLLYLDVILRGFEVHKNLSPEHLTGPIALKRAVQKYKGLARKARSENATAPSKITLLKPESVLPIDWSAKKLGLVPAVCDLKGHPGEFDEKACIAHYPDAYSIHWWAHSWSQKQG